MEYNLENLKKVMFEDGDITRSLDQLVKRTDSDSNTKFLTEKLFDQKLYNKFNHKKSKNLDIFLNEDLTKVITRDTLKYLGLEYGKTQRKIGGLNIEHPFGVARATALITENFSSTISALLHDIPEYLLETIWADQKLTEKDLQKRIKENVLDSHIFNSVNVMEKSPTEDELYSKIEARTNNMLNKLTRFGVETYDKHLEYMVSEEDIDNYRELLSLLSIKILDRIYNMETMGDINNNKNENYIFGTDRRWYTTMKSANLINRVNTFLNEKKFKNNRVEPSRINNSYIYYKSNKELTDILENLNSCLAESGVNKMKETIDFMVQNSQLDVDFYNKCDDAFEKYNLSGCNESNGFLKSSSYYIELFKKSNQDREVLKNEFKNPEESIKLTNYTRKLMTYYLNNPTSTIDCWSK